MPPVMGEIARADYPPLDRVSFGGPLCGSWTAQQTTTLCAKANGLVHLVLTCQQAFPTQLSVRVLTRDLAFDCGVSRILSLGWLGLALRPYIQVIDGKYNPRSLKRPTDCFHEIHEE
jgi:hypothetical protein